jgi:PAS domain S-box-containing protein
MTAPQAAANAPPVDTSVDILVSALRASGVVGLWRWDMQTGLIYGDANFARMYGVTAALLEGGLLFADFLPVFHPDDAPMIERQLQRTFSQEDEFSSEYRVITDARRVRWISARGRIVRDATGTPAQFTGTSVDITDQKLSEMRQAFLLGLSDSLRLLSDSRAILAAVAQALGLQLGANRVGFAQVHADGLRLMFEGGYAFEAAAVHGTYSLTCFGTQHAARLRDGLTLICDDTDLDTNTHTHTDSERGSHSAHWTELAVRAFIVVPHLRGAVLRSVLYVHNRDVRVWSPEEIGLIEDVAARAWDALERTRAEEALRVSEKRLATAVKITALATFQWDTGDNAVYLSDRGREIFGFDAHQALNASDLFLRMHPQDLQRVQAASAVAARDASALEITYRVVRPDASVRWVRSVNDALSVLPGQAVQQVGVFEDVTERMLGEQALRNSELQFRTLAQAIPHQVWTAQPRGRIDWLNARVCEFFDESADALFAGSFADKVHPDDLPEVLRCWRAALPQGLPLKYEMRLRRADGVYRWHIARAEALRGEDGQIQRWVGTSTDIEDQHRAREVLSQLNSNLEARVEMQGRERDRAWKNSPDLQVIVAANGLIRAANDAWLTILGWHPDHVVGRYHLDFSWPEDRRPDGQALAVGLITSVATYENRMLHADGGFRWISWALVPEQESQGDADAAVVYASGRHITAEKQAAAELQATQAQLRQSQKMEAVGQLTGGVAHDFNNLLQVISANLQLMGKHAVGNEKILSRLNSAEGAVRRGAKLASQLLSFSRQQSLEPKVMNVGRFVQGMEDMVRRSIGETIEIETVVCLDPWNALLDMAQTENALLNLAINARDAMQGDGPRHDSVHAKLTMWVSNETVRPEAGRHHADLLKDDYVKLAVSDTGAGMTQAVMAQIFEPFFSTKPVGSGTGLGLSMVYGFVKQSGGHIEVASDLGKGSTLTLYLPRAHQDEEKMQLSEAEPLTGGNECILVAEDDEGVRSTLVELLCDLG